MKFPLLTFEAARDYTSEMIASGERPWMPGDEMIKPKIWFLDLLAAAEKDSTDDGNLGDIAAVEDGTEKDDAGGC